MRDNPYYNQVRLILRVLPQIAKEKRFALKGGTAINLFVRDMPRLSIDVDLTWLPLQPREETLENISTALINLAGSIPSKIHGSAVVEHRGKNTAQIVRLTVKTAEAMIKIEPNLVLRGTVFPCVERELCNDAVALSVKAYNPEKTLADCFKFRNKIGMDVVLEALKLYKSRMKFDHKKILAYARICRVDKIVLPYLEANI